MIDRESIIERSVELYLRNQLYSIRHYPEDKVVILDAYPTGDRMAKPIDKNYIAIGWSADDGGRQAELGSSLKRRLYTFDFYVFGVSRIWGKNIASVVRFSLESDGVINLIDPSDGSTILGYVDVDFVSAQQVIPNNPRPWEENAWVTRLRVEDYYDSSGGR
jgi:hypothetical protein